MCLYAQFRPGIHLKSPVPVINDIGIRVIMFSDRAAQPGSREIARGRRPGSRGRVPAEGSRFHSAARVRLGLVPVAMGGVTSRVVVADGKGSSVLVSKGLTSSGIAVGSRVGGGDRCGSLFASTQTQESKRCQR